MDYSILCIRSSRSKHLPSITIIQLNICHPLLPYSECSSSISTIHRNVYRSSVTNISRTDDAMGSNGSRYWQDFTCHYFFQVQAMWWDHLGQDKPASENHSYRANRSLVEPWQRALSGRLSRWNLLSNQCSWIIFLLLFLWLEKNLAYFFTWNKNYIDFVHRITYQLVFLFSKHNKKLNLIKRT